MSKKNPAILFAGYEIGGQMQLLAETIRKRGYNATAASFNDDFRGYINDKSFNKKGIINTLSRFMFFLSSLLKYDIFHFFWGVSLLSFWRFHLLDLPVLKLFKKKIIVHFRGRDIVNPDYFVYLSSKLSGENVSPVEISRPNQLKKIEKWKHYSDEVLISTPNLLELVPKAKISAQVIDLNYWKTSVMPLSTKDGIIRVVHAPSYRVTKGTELIINAINTVKNKGYPVELVLVENLSYDRTKEIYEICDIGIDQLLIGWYGKYSVEVMALGKPVICYIDPKYTKYRPDLPIVSANEESLEQVLEDLIRNPDLRREIGKKSMEYVSKYHDVEQVVDQLFEIYGLKGKTKRNEFIESAKMW
jgi:glycosyltransferase involved in cell wall biosynthesis